MATWEVSIVVDTAARQVIARDVEQADLERAVAEAQARIRDGAYRHAAWQVGAVCVTRMDKTPDALRAKWEADFYDIDKAGRRRRRYKRPQIERDWEDMVTRDRKEAREAAQAANAQYKQRR